MYYLFFFQAEDGIRDLTVTGVQTCALPISSVFSTNLSAEKSSFDVLNRIDAQRLLTKAAIRPPDLLKSETSAKVAAVISVDALLMGTFRQIGSAIALELSLREATTGKELYHTQYQEQSSDEFEALFPAATDSAGDRKSTRLNSSH